ncbi:hypothetical protein EK21DRAFT_74851 [Setomelanomma holmii]|uniref:Aminoglycoside phosphotransferase domain-containing protein n=1 Tax=Setomelanomma holmii TaxID=210430 RepID=A0A9P4LIE5_9PLEO|nr:hypothetical protein EK21DRAFT_74851 [Setomelanomma holmii]
MAQRSSLPGTNPQTTIDVAKQQDLPTRASHADDLDFDEDSDDYTSSVVSDTSTIEYNQEPYEAFQTKVAQLVLDVFPGHTSCEVVLERIKGGAYNRIIGVTLHDPQPKTSWYHLDNIRNTLSACVSGKRCAVRKSKKYILRIPRAETQDMFHQITTLAYLAKNFRCAVPHVVTFDSSTDNALGRPYMLQKRLSGASLTELWETLNQDQRKCAVRCIAEVVRDMHKITNRCAGIISARNTPHDLITGFIKLEPLPIGTLVSNSGGGRSIFHSPLATPQAPQSFLLSLIQRQRAQHTGLPPFEHVWTGFTDMINSLADAGLLPDTQPFHLHHADFQLRNLLFVPISPTSVRLSGILDWDCALFAPAFMATRAPFFLWSADDADELDESDALIEPEDEGKLELKRVFEEAVGEEFCTDAYRREYVIARRMFYYLVKGVRSGGDVFLAEEVIKEWKELQSANE